MKASMNRTTGLSFIVSGKLAWPPIEGADLGLKLGLKPVLGLVHKLEPDRKSGDSEGRRLDVWSIVQLA